MQSNQTHLPHRSVLLPTSKPNRRAARLDKALPGLRDLSLISAVCTFGTTPDPSGWETAIRGAAAQAEVCPETQQQENSSTLSTDKAAPEALTCHKALNSDSQTSRWEEFYLQPLHTQSMPFELRCQPPEEQSSGSVCCRHPARRSPQPLLPAAQRSSSAGTQPANRAASPANGMEEEFGSRQNS